MDERLMKKFRSQRSARAGGNNRLREIIRHQGGFVPFTGEMMSCVLCHARARSDPRVSLGWRCWVLDGHDHFYICPDHVPPEGVANREQAFTDLYVRACKAHVAATPDYTPAKRVTIWIEREDLIGEFNY
jgi:hypothetical protein